MERVTLNTVHYNLSGEMKQVIQATLAQSKDINAMQTEMGSIYVMLKDIHSHFMPNSRPLPPLPNYPELRSNAGQISLEIPPPRKQQKTTKDNRRNISTTPAFNRSGLKRTEFYVRS
jgi:hypothetical protein